VILIDGATGSNELEVPLRRLGLPVEKAHLEFGDVVFLGRGEGGAPLFIGIELKKISELVTSLRTARFQGHQLLGLTRDFDRRYLLIEGDFHHDDKGRAVVYRPSRKGVRQTPLAGAPNAIAFEQELLNIQTRGGCWLRHTTSRRDTLRFIQACYRYWTDKDLDEHKSHLALYAPDLDKGLLTPASDFRKALTVMLPGIGLAVSKAVEEYVGSALPLRQQLQKVLNMRDTDWSELQVNNGPSKKRLGASRAKHIMETLAR
jgi:ERCC4-type nuclease